MYYITEKSDANASRKWQPTRAKTLAGAKRAAKRAQYWQGTVVAVAVKRDEHSFDQIAVRQNGAWTDID